MCDSPKSYEIDKQVLARSYRMLQSYLHPDKFANKSKVFILDLLISYNVRAYVVGAIILSRAVFTGQQSIFHTSKAIH